MCSAPSSASPRISQAPNSCLVVQLFMLKLSCYLSHQACAEFLELAQTQEKRWQKSLQYERQRRVTLEETVEALARQHNTLERACRKNTGAPNLAELPGAELGRNSDDEEDLEDEDEENAEFFDAIAEHPEGFTLSVSKSHESLQSSSSEQSFSMDTEGAKPLLSGTLSDTTRLSSAEERQDLAEDVIAKKTDVAASVKDQEGSELSGEDGTNSGSNNKIVAVPFTIGGSFGVNVSSFCIVVLYNQGNGAVVRVLALHQCSRSLILAQYQLSVDFCFAQRGFY